MPTDSNFQQTVFTKSSQSFLEDYLNNPSPTGFESEGQKKWLAFLKPYIDEHFIDPYGSAVGIINPGKDFKVVIEAHADEISWFVNYISPEGLIYVVRNGGSDHQIAPSMRVNIHGDNGTVKAVFGWPAIHTRLHKKGGKEVTPKVENIFLDCGATSKEEVEEMGIHVGSVATFEDGYQELANGRFVCRALDNRAGGFMIAQVARLLKENKKELPFSLYVVNSVQEEVGLHGAQMVSRRIKPNLAIVTDVTHDSTTPMINKKIEGETACGKGPVLTYAPAVHNLLLKTIRESADKNRIPYQLAASSSATGTDTDAFAYSADGVPSALISLPLRYMHTTAEMVTKSDVAQTVKLMYHVLLDISPDMKLLYL